MEWFNGARWRLSLSHCFEGLLIQIPVALLFGLTAGTVAVIAWYWSRKKLEIEMLAGHDQNPVSTWSVGWLPWTWDKWRQLDLYFPAVSSVATLLIFSWK
jgi:hypothetical protein